MIFQTTTINETLRIIHFENNSDIAHCGLFLNVGSRDENEDEYGMAHFVEHSIFKGTKTRKSWQIISYLENVGAELDAYTTKEETAVYAVFLKEYFERATDLIFDMVFNSVFPEKEIEKEKEVVLEEINTYKDSPSESVFDDFEELIFQNHPIAHNILGTEETVKNLTVEKIKAFVDKMYIPQQMIFCSVGNIDFRKVIKTVKHFFDCKHNRTSIFSRQPFVDYKPVKKMINNETVQAHCMIGGPAYHQKHPKHYGLVLLNNILGGAGMNSRLNLSLREKYACTYSVESYLNSYSDCGLLGVYFGTDRKNLDFSIELTIKEFNKLRTTKLGTIQLAKAKKQIIGQTAIGLDNKDNMFLRIGKKYLFEDEILSISEIAKRIEKVTSEDLLDIANELLIPDKFSTIIYE